MIYWSPTEDTTIECLPIGGWNSTFSEEDKIKYINLFSFFKIKKGYNDTLSNSLAQMVIYKQKYKGMCYSDEQEQLIKEALRPIFNS